MKAKTTLLAACTALLLTGTNAFAVISLSVSFNLTLTDVVDPNGFDGSTWTFDFTSSQETYGNTFGQASLTSDSMSLAISGVGNDDYNGTFALVNPNTTNFLVTPSVGFTLFYALDTSTGSGDFTFGAPPIAVTGINFSGSSIASPNVGEPVLVSDFEGVSLINGGDVSLGFYTFDFGSGTIHASLVPEPSTYAALAGLSILGFVAYRRRLSC